MEQTFNHLKMIKSRLCSHLSDFEQLMRISIDGPAIDAVEFGEILEIFKHIIIEYYFYSVV